MTPVVPRGVLREAARARLAGGPTAPPALARAVFRLERVAEPVAERLLDALLEGDPAFERRSGAWRLVPPPAPEPRTLRHLPFVVVDVETTGGRPTVDRVVEIAAVRTVGGRIVAEWSSLVDPGRPIPPMVRRITGIDEARVAGAPRFREVVDAFLDVLGGAPFVAHNARFDRRFVDAELARARGVRLTNATLCTVRLARRLLPGVRRRNLDALAHLYGIPIEGRHRALPDARATARILHRLLAAAAEAGIEDESELAGLAGAGGTLAPGAP